MGLTLERTDLPRTELPDRHHLLQMQPRVPCASHTRSARGERFSVSLLGGIEVESDASNGDPGESTVPGLVLDRPRPRERIAGG